MNHCNNHRVEEIGDGSNLLKNDLAADRITVCNKKKTGTKGIIYEADAGVPKDYTTVHKGNLKSYGFSGTSASILMTFANPGFPAESVFGQTVTDFARDGNSINKNGFLNILRLIRILGLMALISYMIVILFTWISANLGGFIYFSAGEPDPSIKYPEWVLGFLGIVVAADYLKRELDGDKI